jgi:hypothetical protein
MVWAAAKNILKKTEPCQAAISRRAYFLLSSFRNPVKAFFVNKCEPHATKDQWIKAEDLFREYSEWFDGYQKYYAARFPFLRSEIGLATNKLKQMAPTAFNKELWSIYPYMKKSNKGIVFFFLSIKNDYTPQNPGKAAMVDHINHLDAVSNQYESFAEEQRQTEALRQNLTRKAVKLKQQMQQNPALTFTRNGATMMPPPMYQDYPNSFRGPKPWYQPVPLSPPPSRTLSWSRKKVKEPEPKAIVIVGTCQSDDTREYEQEQHAIMDGDGPYRRNSSAAMAYYDEYGEYPVTHWINPWGNVIRATTWEAYVDACLLRMTNK